MAVILVQHRGTTGSLTLSYSLAQSSGNLNVVRIITTTSGTITSISDTQGNVYALATSFTDSTDGIVCWIYYAKNIAAHVAGNLVTINGTVTNPDLWIQEYSGCDTVSPLGPVNQHLGSGTTIDAGSLTNTVGDSVLAVVFWCNDAYTGHGANFIDIDSPNAFGNGAEDRIVTAIGTYATPATQGANVPFLGVCAAFQAAGATLLMAAGMDGHFLA